jgi:hypothetical protein
MTAIAHHPHRVSTAVTHARTALAGVAEVPVWSMDAGETTTILADLCALAAQVAELEARVLSHADRIEIEPTSSPSAPTTTAEPTTPPTP